MDCQKPDAATKRSGARATQLGVEPGAARAGHAGGSIHCRSATQTAERAEHLVELAGGQSHLSPALPAQSPADSAVDPTALTSAALRDRGPKKRRHPQPCGNGGAGDDSSHGPESPRLEFTWPCSSPCHRPCRRPCSIERRICLGQRSISCRHWQPSRRKPEWRRPEERTEFSWIWIGFCGLNGRDSPPQRPERHQPWTIAAMRCHALRLPGAEPDAHCVGMVPEAPAPLINATNDSAAHIAIAPAGPRATTAGSSAQD